MQEESTKTGKVTSAGMFFLCFPVYGFDQANSVRMNTSKKIWGKLLIHRRVSGIHFLLNLNQMAVNKDPDTAFFKKLDGFQPCEINELKAGTHVFAVYGKLFPCIVPPALACNFSNSDALFSRDISQVTTSSKVQTIQ